MSRRLFEVLGVAAVLIAVVPLLRFARAPVDANTAGRRHAGDSLGRAGSAGDLDEGHQ